MMDRRAGAAFLVGELESGPCDLSAWTSREGYLLKS